MKNLSLFNLLKEILNKSVDLEKDRLVPIPARSLMIKRSESEEPQIKRVSSDFIPVPMVPIVALIDYIIDQIKQTLKYNKTVSEKSISYITPLEVDNLNRAVEIFESLKEYLVNTFPDQFVKDPGSVTTIKIPGIKKQTRVGEEILTPFVPIVELNEDIIWELNFSIKRNKGVSRHEPWFINPGQEKILKEAIKELKLFKNYIISNFPEQFE